MTQTAKLFNNGRSQAVRLPAAFRFDTKEVFIRQDPSSVVVVFDLMTHGQDRHVSCILDLVQRYIAGATQRNQQLAQERAVTGLAVDERHPAEASLDGVPDRVNRQLR